MIFKLQKTLASTICIVFIAVVIITGETTTNSVFAQQTESVDWNQWRGPSRDGTFTGPKWPEKLDESSLASSWRVELGASYSGPIVTNDKVFVTETQSPNFEVVRALDRDSGKQIWESRWQGSMKVPFFAAQNGSWIRSTPAYSDGRLYVGGMVDVLVCLDAESGKQIWKIDFPKEYGTKKPDFGFVCSPLVIDDAVYVQAGGGFKKINKLTGAIIWESLSDGGGMYGSAFSSPYPTTLNGMEQILVQTRQDLTGIDSDSGAVLWKQRVPSFRGMNILTPMVYKNAVFTSSYRNSSYLYRINANSAAWSVDKAWETKKAAYMSSPVIKDGHVYMHLGNQRFTCIDLESGQTKWTSGPFGKYASLILQDDKILALDQRGELIMFQATPKSFQLIDRRQVSNQETWAHLAVSGRELFVRELNAVSAFRFSK